MSSNSSIQNTVKLLHLTILLTILNSISIMIPNSTLSSFSSKNIMRCTLAFSFFLYTFMIQLLLLPTLLKSASLSNAVHKATHYCKKNDMNAIRMTPSTITFRPTFFILIRKDLKSSHLSMFCLVNFLIIIYLTIITSRMINTSRIVYTYISRMINRYIEVLINAPLLD